MSFDWKGTIGKVAPWLAGTLASPAAGIAVDALCRLVGLEPTKENAEKAAQMVAAGELSGPQFIELKKLELEHEAKMQAMGYENLETLDSISAADRASARDREIKTGDSWTPRILAGIVVVGWLGVQIYLLGHVVPGEMRELILRSMGTLDMALGLVLGYYFGSSRGSSMKDETIAKMNANSVVQK